MDTYLGTPKSEERENVLSSGWIIEEEMDDQVLFSGSPDPCQSNVQVTLLVTDTRDPVDKEGTPHSEGLDDSGS